MRASSQAQPNIALVKYWGKRDVARNLPAVGSLSITLDALHTKMAVDFSSGAGADTLHLNGEPEERSLARVSRCLDLVCGRQRPRATVTSTCNFPIAAGLASSASAFAALVVAAAAAAGHNTDRLTLARLAGAASGSAARSLLGGFVELTAGADDIDVQAIAAPSDWPLDVVVAVTARGEKPVSSGEAMQRSAASSPFYERWVAGQGADLDAARAAVNARDFAALTQVAEHNCLKMHSVMWTSRPSVVYWNPTTLACMQTVRELRAQGLEVFFTIDAGPQVKAVCPPEHTSAVSAALRKTAGVIDVMHSGLGEGARLLESAKTTANA